MANVDLGNGTFALDLVGGCPCVVDPQKPHLGGNMNGGDGGTDFSEDLWPWMVKKYEIKNLLDVGCAEGHALRFFRSQGVNVMGLDGLWQNAVKCGVPVLVHDLHSGPVRINGVDMIWCCDVVEHINEEFVPNIMATFQGAERVALCHGTEGMGHSGWHHVNNKSVEYWAGQMGAAGFDLDTEGTAESHEITKGRSYWPDSGRIWLNRAFPKKKAEPQK